LFGRLQKKTALSPPSAGILELIFCVFDEKHKIHHSFRANQPDISGANSFLLIDHPERIRDNPLLKDAFNLRTATSFSFSFGTGQQKYLYILPYERKSGKWRFACLQITTVLSASSSLENSCVCALAEDRVCLILVDSGGIICSVSSRIPESFGYTTETLLGIPLADLFSPSDIEVLQACSADTNESITSCSLLGQNGSKRDVELKKFSAADKYMLYSISDVAPKHRLEEFAMVTSRERRRIGQDLHDSIGQIITGISLLSRSLSNSLKKEDHDRSEDASQISELSDDASNQIRQISRGLMPSEIVQRGLHIALQDLARTTTESCGIICEAQLDDALLFSDVAVETHLYRIAQEAVNNAVRHAQAGRIDIIISEINGLQQLEVVDDGAWSEPEDTISGIGLKTMEYRASAIGGQLHIGALEQGGTRVACRMEKDESLATRV
jgi:PAS domain S-box-containing protein